MRVIYRLCTLVVLAGLAAPSARADITFDTLSKADQSLTSPVLGGTVNIHSTGTQHFTINPSTGFADVTSSFHGTDLPDPSNPGGFASYDLYNTVTNGTVTQNPSGSYNIRYLLLFELKITSGALNGLTFETQSNAIFENKTIPSLPFPAGTTFRDLTSPITDAVFVYVKNDPTGTFPSGTLVGTSTNRVVTVLGVVPEPTGAVLLGLGTLGLGLIGARRVRV